MTTKAASRFSVRPALLIAALLLTSACAQSPDVTRTQTIDPERRAFALQEAKALRANGRRVWCVPFARNISGIELRGNAKTWWGKAATEFDRGHEPNVGAVMAFSAKPGMPLGHIAVVSEITSPREIKIDHANWHRNKVSLGMRVMDVSRDNDWSSVRVETNPGSFGSVYRISGFIYPKT